MPEIKKDPIQLGATEQQEQKKAASAIHAMMDNLVASGRQQTLLEVAKVMAEYDVPDRGLVPDLVNRRGESVIQVRSPLSAYYRQFSEAEREWRNPDSDHWSMEWLRGTYMHDVPRTLHAEAKLAEMFGRTVLDEGVVSGVGGFATGLGGTVLPRPLEALVGIARDRVAKMRMLGPTVYQMTAQEHNIPTAAAMTAAMVGESTSGAEGQPTLAQVALVARTGAVVASLTRELLDDAVPNLITVLTQKAGGALGVLEDNQFFRLGSGTAPNISRMTGTTFTETTSTFLAFSDVARMWRAVPQQYRAPAVWLVAADVLGFLQGVRDGQGRQFYMGMTDSPSPMGDDPGIAGTLMRRPVYEVPWSNGELWFGEVGAQYAIGNRQGISIEISREARFLNREVVFLVTERFAGQNVDASASQYCTGITSATSL